MEVSSIEGLQAHWLQLLQNYSSLLSQIQLYKHLVSRLNATEDASHTADTSQLDLETHEHLDEKRASLKQDIDKEIQRESDTCKSLLEQLAAPDLDTDLKELLDQADLLETEMEKRRAFENPVENLKEDMENLKGQISEWKIKIEQVERLKERHAEHIILNQTVPTKEKKITVEDQMEKFMHLF